MTTRAKWFALGAAWLVVILIGMAAGFRHGFGGLLPWVWWGFIAGSWAFILGPKPKSKEVKK